MASVRLENVKKIYDGNVTAVHEFSLDIKDKEFIVLVGPSGCGKSTTLRMIAGLEDVSEGDLFIDGVRMNDIPPKDRDIAMVFQNYALYPHMTVYDNMAFGLKLRKFDKSEIDLRVRDAAKILGIEDYLDRKPKALSGGQRQRVAVGRAIVRKPKVFLFDEPLSNLDAKLRVQMRTEISKLHQRLGATMIYVTHDQTEAMTMADRIVLMKDGFVQQIDTPLEIYGKPANLFVAGFIGSPAMNTVDGTLKKRGVMTFEEKKGMKLTVPPRYRKTLAPWVGKAVTVGIRPEHLTRGSARGSSFRARVEVVEPMGSELYVYFSTSEQGRQHVARLGTAHTVGVGKAVQLAVDTGKLHFFDTDTGLAIV